MARASCARPRWTSRQPHGGTAGGSQYLATLFLGAAATADIVTYYHDPRQDPGQLADPGGGRGRRNPAAMNTGMPVSRPAS